MIESEFGTNSRNQWTQPELCQQFILVEINTKDHRECHFAEHRAHNVTVDYFFPQDQHLPREILFCLIGAWCFFFYFL